MSSACSEKIPHKPVNEMCSSVTCLSWSQDRQQTTVAGGSAARPFSKYLIVSRNVVLIQFHLQPIRRSRNASFFSWASMDNVICIPELSGMRGMKKGTGKKFWWSEFSAATVAKSKHTIWLKEQQVKCFAQIWQMSESAVCGDRGPCPSCEAAV